jgi:hypothetical protein
MRGHTIHFDLITRYNHLDNIPSATPFLPKEVALAAMLLSCIREKSVSDPTPTTLNKIFRGFSQAIHVHARTVSEIRTKPASYHIRFNSLLTDHPVIRRHYLN